MAVADYNTLVASKATAGSIKHALNSDAIPVTTIVSDAEQEIFRRLRVREMLATTTNTMATGTDTLSLPTGYIAARSIVYTGTHAGTPLDRKQAEDVEAGYQYDSAGDRVQEKPDGFYVLPDTVQLNKTPDQAYPYRMLYWKQPDTLSTSNASNFLTTKFPRLLRAMCMAYGNEWLKNATEREWWLRVAGEMIETLNAEADMEMRNSDVVVTAE